MYYKISALSPKFLAVFTTASLENLPWDEKFYSSLVMYLVMTFRNLESLYQRVTNNLYWKSSLYCFKTNGSWLWFPTSFQQYQFWHLYCTTIESYIDDVYKSTDIHSYWYIHSQMIYWYEMSLRMLVFLSFGPCVSVRVQRRRCSSLWIQCHNFGVTCVTISAF